MKFVGGREPELILQLTLNKVKFDLSVSTLIDEAAPPPFYEYTFFKNHRFQIYGVLSSEGISNQYYHYFVREGGQFHYVGLLPYLVYDEKRKFICCP